MPMDVAARRVGRVLTRRLVPLAKLPTLARAVRAWAAMAAASSAAARAKAARAKAARVRWS